MLVRASKLAYHTPGAEERIRPLQDKLVQLCGYDGAKMEMDFQKLPFAA